MMKKKLFLSMLLLLVGVGMQAQSIASEQMDERFNDGTKFPRGWFGEGWKIKDGKAKAKATEDSGNSGFPGMGGGGMPSTNPSTNPSDNPSAGMPGMPGVQCPEAQRRRQWHGLQLRHEGYHGHDGYHLRGGAVGVRQEPVGARG